MEIRKEKCPESSLYRSVAAAVIGFMKQVRITERTELNRIEDHGLLGDLAAQHQTSDSILKYREYSQDAYLMICGMHAFGAGVCLALVQSEQETAEAMLGDAEPCENLKRAFREIDAYELALKGLQIPEDSNNKKILDQIILTAIEAVQEVDMDAPAALTSYMQALFDGGVTMVLRR